MANHRKPTSVLTFEGVFLTFYERKFELFYMVTFRSLAISTYIHTLKKSFPRRKKHYFKFINFIFSLNYFFLQIFPNILLKDIEIMMTNKSVTKKRSVISKLHFFIVLVYVTTSVTLASPVDLKNDVITSSRHNLKLLVDADGTPNIAQFETSHSKEQILAKREEQIQNLATSVLGSSR